MSCSRHGSSLTGQAECSPPAPRAPARWRRQAAALAPAHRVPAPEFQRQSARRPALVGCALALLLVAGGCVQPGAPAVTAWVVGADLQVDPASEPLLENDFYSAAAGRVELAAAVNETISFQVGLRSASWPSPQCDVRVTPLRTGGRDAIPPEAIRVYRQQEVEIADLPSWYSAHTHRQATPITVFDVLVPWDAPRGGGPVRPARRASAFAWVDIHVPTGTPPGEYRGRLEVITRGATEPSMACDVLLRVGALALPSAPTLPIVVGVDPRSLLAEQLDWPTRAAAESMHLLPAEPTHQTAIRLIEGVMQRLHEHRLNPVLRASFPKYRVAGPDAVEIDWDAYDALVARWIDGDAYADRVRSAIWPLPVSAEYPDARQNGGFGSAQYARLLAAYAAACERHFAERGWSDRALLRVLPPAEPTDRYVADQQRVAETLRQANLADRLLVHLPAESLAGLGWAGAPPIQIAEVGLWAPIANVFDPAAMGRRQARGDRVLFVPGEPPYSGTLSRAGPAGDALTLAWQAYRYGCDGIWIESALAPPRSVPRANDPLLASGQPYGLNEPLPTVRLKRLRRGQQDYELLRLLERSGKPALAQRTAAQVVRWAFTEACAENLLSTRESGWSPDGAVCGLARQVVRRELVADAPPSPAGDSLRARAAESWGRLMRSAARVQASVRGVRLVADREQTRAAVFALATNTTPSTVSGSWTFGELPPGWSALSAAAVSVPPNQSVRRELELEVGGLAYNADGTFPIPLSLELDGGGSEPATARLAVTTCPVAPDPPDIDGDLSDWLISVHNTAGDFRLVRGHDAGGGTTPTLPSRAYFACDADTLYVAVSCALESGEPPRWTPQNRIGLDGAIPWGEDVVEVILQPFSVASGSGADLYTLQVKPSGLLVARRGALTEPPLNPSTPWQCDARVAVRVDRRAWNVELAVPLAAFGDDARRERIWGANIARLDARRGEYSSWSGARGYAYLPELLGNLLLLRP